MALTPTSSTFEYGQPVPRRHTREGDDIAPPPKWGGIRSGTKTLALIVEAPDAPEPVPRGCRPVPALPGVAPIMRGRSAFMTIDQVLGFIRAPV